MSTRREVMNYLGAGAIGSIIGFYAGAQELLGIQSEETQPGVVSPTETPTETPTERPTDIILNEDFQNRLADWEVQNPAGWENRDITPAEITQNDQFDASVRTVVDGSPSGVRFNRTVGEVPSELTVTLGIYSPMYTDDSQIGSLGGGIHIDMIRPNEEKNRVWKLGDAGKNELADNDGHGEFNINLDSSYPGGTIISIWTKTWPGRVVFFYKYLAIESSGAA